MISEQKLSEARRLAQEARQRAGKQAGLHATVIAEVEHWLISDTLIKTSGNQSRAARVLGIARNTLKEKMRKLGIGSLR